jgi:hypothetical protein
MPTDPEKCDEALRLAIQILQARSGPSDIRLWRQFLMFAPEWLIIECSEKIRARQRRLARRAV